MKKSFVFVVCGAKEHIDTLHFSLEYLIRRTKNDVIVLTDSSRNEIPIEHDKVIDVLCPEDYNHHQASIYLKTGIYRFLPKGVLYCYLDTDVLAIGKNTDDIFLNYVQPITFANDHCVVNEFSAYAVNCGCLEEWEGNWNRYNQAYDQLSRNGEIPLVNRPFQKELRQIFSDIRKSWIIMVFTFIRYIFSRRYFKLNEVFFFDRKTRMWKHVKLGDVLHDPPKAEIAKLAGLNYNRLMKKWSDSKGRELWNPTCTHLIANISSKFDVRTIEKKWNHWNGGVFLFDDSSHDFLSRWHEWTLSCFEDYRFKTRDQGTLMATVWSFNLEMHPTLSKRWNLLADYHSNKFVFHPEKGSFTWQQKEEISQPEFIHIYHHWGDKSWDVWQWVVDKKDG